MRCWLILALDLVGGYKIRHLAAPSTGRESTATSCDIILPLMVRHNTTPDQKMIAEKKNGVVEVVWRNEVQWER